MSNIEDVMLAGVKRIQQLDDEVQTLRSENKRLREALEAIWKGGGSPKSDFYHRIAKQALKKELDNGTMGPG